MGVLFYVLIVAFAIIFYSVKIVRPVEKGVVDPSLAKTTLRAVIGKMTLTESNENRDKINTDVEVILDKQTDPWGITVIRVELQRIEPPQDVQAAMNNVVKAENEKIAAKDIATANAWKQLLKH
ncbi:MAG: SPFH domain-containing protein [Candidatus Margulisiibacteriota bacterium]